MLHLLKNQINYTQVFLQLSVLVIFGAFPNLSFGQSQVEIESEMTVGDSDAAMAEEKQIQARLQEDNAKEEAAKKAAARNYESTKKRTAEINSHIEDMKVGITKANKKRTQSETEIKIEQKRLSKLEKKESEFKAELARAESRLDTTNKKRDQLLTQISQTKDQTQKTKEEIAATKGKEFIAKSETKSAAKKLTKANDTLAETKKWRNKEAKRIAAEIKNLNRDQSVIENKIRVSSTQIKKLQEEVASLKKKNAVASENHERAAALKNENDLELARLQKMKREPASANGSASSQKITPAVAKQSPALAVKPAPVHRNATPPAAE